MKVWAYWSVTDPKTKVRAEARADLSTPTILSVDKLKIFAEQLHEERRNESVHSEIGKGAPMDVGAVMRR